MRVRELEKRRPGESRAKIGWVSREYGKEKSDVSTVGVVKKLKR